jgi:hypothetical protein
MKKKKNKKNQSSDLSIGHISESKKPFSVDHSHQLKDKVYLKDALYTSQIERK